jgi:hypothetical protein
MNRFSDKVHVELKIVDEDIDHVVVLPYEDWCEEFWGDDDCWVDENDIVRLPKKDIEINHDGTITLPYRLAIEKGLV